MKKKLLMVLISVSMIASVFTGCGNSTETKDSGKVTEVNANASNISLNVLKGIYIVRVADQATKVIVK